MQCVCGGKTNFREYRYIPVSRDRCIGCGRVKTAFLWSGGNRWKIVKRKEESKT